MKAVAQYLTIILALILAFGAESQAVGGSLSTSTENGHTTVIFDNKAVWSGHTVGSVNSLSRNINGTDYAAAFDAEKLLWESCPGAGTKLKNESACRISLPALTLNRDGGGQGPILKTVNGDAVLLYKGKEINLGKQSGPLSVESSSTNGMECVVVRSGAHVIWKY